MPDPGRLPQFNVVGFTGHRLIPDTERALLHEALEWHTLMSHLHRH